MRRASEPGVDTGRQIAIRVLVPNQLGAATTLLAEGMRDNPLHVKAFGTDVQNRQRRLQRFIGQLVGHVYSNGTLLGAFVRDELAGVLGMMKPHRCRPTHREVLRMASVIIASNPPLGVWRIHRWLSNWSRNDPHDPHAHIGPLAVLPPWRRQGLARNLMTECCRCLDAQAEIAWLETDLAINVTFYETLGFVVARCEPVLGVMTWFMRREPRSTASR